MTFLTGLTHWGIVFYARALSMHVNKRSGTHMASWMCVCARANLKRLMIFGQKRHILAEFYTYDIFNWPDTLGYLFFMLEHLVCM